MKKTELKGGGKEDLNNKNSIEEYKKEGKKGMAYYCNLCQCWHYEGSEIHQRHKIYASQQKKPRKVVRRKRKKSFWDRW